MNEKSWWMEHASLIIAVLAMGSFMAYVTLYVMLKIFKPTIVIDPDVNGTIVGILGTGGFTAAVQYWLGSSSGSTDKNKQQADTIQGLLKRQEGPPPPPPAGHP